MEIKEVSLCGRVAEELIDLSADWEAEGCCYGYRKNEYADLEGNRIFLAEEGGKIIGYLFGNLRKSEGQSAVMPDGTDYFEVEELYVRPEWRSQGVVSALFCYMEAQVRPEAKYLMLGTASKNCRGILHFYMDELGMEFWSAALFRML